MTEIYNRHIDHPSAWTSVSLGGPEAIHRPLSDAELNAIDEVLARTRHLRPQESTRADWNHPVVNKALAGIDHEVKHGRGAIIVTGITPERYTAEQFQRIYWGFGTHMGIAAIQSNDGDRLGYVEVDPDNPTGRGYRSDSEQQMHSDNREIVGLMCVRRAESGGVSRIASALAVHNEMLKTCPELLPPLYKGFYLAIDEMKFTSKPVTDEMFPTFCYVDGVVSGMYTGNFYRTAAEKLGVPLPEGLGEACDAFRRIAVREDVRLSFLIEPGQMLLLNNFTTVHSRTAFRNSEKNKRLLFRLWLDVPVGGRPVVPEMYIRGKAYDFAWAERRLKLAQPA